MRGLTMVAALLVCVPAQAGFDRWTAEVEDDPFSGGQTVAVNYMTTIRSGAIIFCDSQGDGVRVRAIPGFAYVADLAGFKPSIELAVDGTMIGSALGNTGSVGDSLAIAEAEFVGSDGRNFVRAFAAARKQIAIKDGISDRPHLLRASGSTKAGNALLGCLRKQKGWVE